MKCACSVFRDSAPCQAEVEAFGEVCGYCRTICPPGGPLHEPEPPADPGLAPGATPVIG